MRDSSTHYPSIVRPAPRCCKAVWALACELPPAAPPKAAAVALLQSAAAAALADGLRTARRPAEGGYRAGDATLLLHSGLLQTVRALLKDAWKQARNETAVEVSAAARSCALQQSRWGRARQKSVA